MAVKFVPCTSKEQADEMYWAGLLYFRLDMRWSPNDFDLPEVKDCCKPSRIIGGGYLKGSACGYFGWGWELAMGLNAGWVADMYGSSAGDRWPRVEDFGIAVED